MASTSQCFQNSCKNRKREKESNGRAKIDTCLVYTADFGAL